jgi:hypothetical protein
VRQGWGRDGVEMGKKLLEKEIEGELWEVSWRRACGTFESI